MMIEKEASAGTVESADVYVTVQPADALEIQITSPVGIQFGRAMKQTIQEILKAAGIRTAKVIVDDHGALDWILRARLETAIDRAKGGQE